MTDLPPLPDTDDPHRLLGVAADASDREIRSAYARLIRVYRPDRAPGAFQRIHAAYELVRGGDAPATITAVAATPEPRPARHTVTQAEAHVRSAWADASAVRGDELDRLVARTLAAGAPIDEILDDLDQDTVFAVLDSKALTWSALIEHHDLDVAEAIALAALRSRLADDEAPGIEAVLDDRWLADAHDPAVARLGWFTAGALTWQRPATGLVERLRSLPNADAIENLIDLIELDLTASDELRRTRERLPPELMQLLAVDRLGTPADRSAAAAEVREAMTQHRDEWLAEFAAQSNSCPKLAGALYARLVAGVWRERARLDQLPKPQFDELAVALHAAGRGLGLLHVALASFALFALGILIAPMGFWVGVGAGAGTLGLYLGTENRRYRRTIRPRLADVAARLGVTGACIIRWIRLNGWLAGRLSSYDIVLEGDYGFQLFAATAAWAASVDDPD